MCHLYYFVSFRGRQRDFHNRPSSWPWNQKHSTAANNFDMNRPITSERLHDRAQRPAGSNRSNALCGHSVLCEISTFKYNNSEFEYRCRFSCCCSVAPFSGFASTHPPTHPRDCIRDHRRLQGGVRVVGWGRRCSLQGLVDLRKHRLIPIRLTPEHAQ